ncbi:RHS repeat domain-containing protein [Dyadobacter psychrotolerans]|uniref:RHS repeat-associated core domain-containing protein n=1 Tax=Dyadobacter psychrotolerans TaxID=2541721 RepID=A0A4R5E0J0_9BACT|nr:RHS repeat-associated core domain-containing protein [Dyadobacter psychrotolerans]TDE18534.1 RHS repeat-associated core domain-containing protein [Dyadobacter psychrotolerans]
MIISSKIIWETYGRGGVPLVWDESGQIIKKSDYFAFGLEIDRNNPVQTPAVRNGINRYTFLGRESQPETGYMDLKRRFYDPATGRFIQVDPVTKSQEKLSVYQYGWNNPIRYSDPNGDCPICDDFKKLWNGAKNYLTQNASMYAKGSAEVTGGYRVALGIGKATSGDMNAASARLLKVEASYDSKDNKKGKVDVDYISKPDAKGQKTMTISHGVEGTALVYGGGAKTEYQVNSSGRVSGEGTTEVQVAATIAPPFAIFGKFETDKLTGQSSVQIGVSAGYKGGAGVVTDNNAEFGFKFRVPVEEKKP